jgi:hypothetical protein
MSSSGVAMAPSLRVTNALGRSPPVRVRDPDDCAFEHGRMGADRLLDFDAGDVRAAGDDDVLATVAQFDVAVGTHDVVPAHDHLAHRDSVPGDIVHLLADDTDEIGGGVGLSLTSQIPGPLLHRKLAPPLRLGTHSDRAVGLGQAVHVHDAEVQLAQRIQVRAAIGVLHPLGPARGPGGVVDRDRLFFCSSQLTGIAGEAAARNSSY